MTPEQRHEIDREQVAILKRYIREMEQAEYYDTKNARNAADLGNLAALLRWPFGRKA